MNKNQEVKSTQKPEPASVSVSAAKSLQNDANLERVFVMPSVPRPGKTSWSLVL